MSLVRSVAPHFAVPCLVMLQVSAFCAAKGNKTLSVAEMKILQQKIGAINIRNRGAKGLLHTPTTVRQRSRSLRHLCVCCLVLQATVCPVVCHC